MESNGKLSSKKLATHIICSRSTVAAKELQRNPVTPGSEIRYFYQCVQTLQHHVLGSVQNTFSNPEIGRAAFTPFGTSGKGIQPCKIQTER